MRIVLQRASSARVVVSGSSSGATVVGELPSPGLVLFVGVTHDDTPDDAIVLASKIWGLRVLEGEQSASDLQAPMLVISQFTLYATVRKGRRPSWSQAAPGPVSQPLFELFVQCLRDLGAHVETGVFGADMAVELVNDGPVTLMVDSADLATPRG
ncbi:D-aminoacyl-tRNA deacylase [Propionibacteriaceae bacterium G1746]